MKRLLLTFTVSALLFANAPASASSADAAGIPWVRNSTDACVWVTVESETGTFSDPVSSHGERQFRKPEHAIRVRFEFNDPYLYPHCVRGNYVNTLDEEDPAATSTFTVFTLTGRNKHYAVSVSREN